MDDTDHPRQPVSVLQESVLLIPLSICPALQYLPEPVLSSLPDCEDRSVFRADYEAVHRSRPHAVLFGNGR